MRLIGRNYIVGSRKLTLKLFLFVCVYSLHSMIIPFRIYSKTECVEIGFD